MRRCKPCWIRATRWTRTQEPVSRAPTAPPSSAHLTWTVSDLDSPHHRSTIEATDQKVQYTSCCQIACICNALADLRIATSSSRHRSVCPTRPRAARSLYTMERRSMIVHEGSAVRENKADSDQEMKQELDRARPARYRQCEVRGILQSASTLPDDPRMRMLIAFSADEQRRLADTRSANRPRPQVERASWLCRRCRTEQPRRP